MHLVHTRVWFVLTIQTGVGIVVSCRTSRSRAGIGTILKTRAHFLINQAHVHSLVLFTRILFMLPANHTSIFPRSRTFAFPACVAYHLHIYIHIHSSSCSWWNQAHARIFLTQSCTRTLVLGICIQNVQPTSPKLLHVYSSATHPQRDPGALLAYYMQNSYS